MPATVMLSVPNLRPRTVIAWPGVSGLLGLIVATSNAGFQSAGLGVRGGGAGGVHAASAVTFLRSSLADPGPCDHVPSIEPASGASGPSNVPLMPGKTIFTTPLWNVTFPGNRPGPWSMLANVALIVPPSF